MTCNHFVFYMLDDLTFQGMYILHLYNLLMFWHCFNVSEPYLMILVPINQSFWNKTFKSWIELKSFWKHNYSRVFGNEGLDNQK